MTATTHEPKKRTRTKNVEASDNKHVIIRSVLWSDLNLNPENERDADQSHESNIGLRQSIVANGVLTPLQVYPSMVVANGNRRLTAIKYAVENEGSLSKDFMVPVMVIPEHSTDVEAALYRLNTNAAEQFSPIEQAHLFDKLRQSGMNDSEIARRSPFTSAHVGNMLRLWDSGENVRNIIRDGKMSATLAAETVKREDGKSLIEEAVNLAISQGKGKATQKHVDAVVAARLMAVAAKKEVPAEPTSEQGITTTSTTPPPSQEEEQIEEEVTITNDQGDTPVTAEPVTAEPVTAEPVTAEPVTAEPVTAEPVTAEPVTSTTPHPVGSTTPTNGAEQSNNTNKFGLKEAKEILSELYGVLTDLAQARITGTPEEFIEQYDGVQEHLSKIVLKMAKNGITRD